MPVSWMLVLTNTDLTYSMALQKRKNKEKKTLYLLDKKGTNEERTESDGLTCFVGFMTV